MKHAALVAAVVMVMGAGWFGAAAILGEQPQQGPSAAPPPAAPSAPAPPAPAPSVPPAPPAPPAPAPAPQAPSDYGPVAIPRHTEEPVQPAPAPVAVPKKAPEPVKGAQAPVVTTPKTDGFENIIPPPQMPDVDIPPIPEVKKEAPFKPGPRPVAKKKSDAIEEGKRLFDREGRLEVDPLGRPYFVFDSSDKPMQLLENTQRELLEITTDHGKRRAKWRVSGIVTVYEGKNYFLLTRATRILAEEENL